MRAQPPWYVEVLPPFAILVAPLLLPSPSNLPFPVFPLLFHTTAATESDARDHAAPAAPPRSPPPAAPAQAPPGAPPRLRAGNRKTGRVRCAAPPRTQSCGRPRAPSRVASADMEGARAPAQCGGRGRRRPFGRWGTGCGWTGDKGRVGRAGRGGLSVARGGGLGGSRPRRTGLRGAPDGRDWAGGKKTGRVRAVALGAGNNAGLTEQKSNSLLIKKKSNYFEIVIYSIICCALF